jgi:hypothetical protein
MRAASNGLYGKSVHIVETMASAIRITVKTFSYKKKKSDRPKPGDKKKKGEIQQAKAREAGRHATASALPFWYASQK